MPFLVPTAPIKGVWYLDGSTIGTDNAIMQLFVDRLRWADFFFDRNESNTLDTPGYSHEELGPFT